MSSDTSDRPTTEPPTQAVDSWEVPTFDATLTRPEPLALPDLPPGRRIGPYRIEGILGTGGMGAVYLALRDDLTFEKRVAIKVARGILASPDTGERFRRERQILAGLEHPMIARLLDGGTTDDGMPYFVMEYIEGRPIQAYCDQARLDTRARLGLFLDVCAPVEYAHRRLVVHRDLKPGNILVTAEGVPKLLDFGIAKLVEPDSPAAPTQATSLAFTPFYASPEQVQGEAVTTATDVYSLGVLLYEMLTGHGPYRLSTLAPLEVMKAIVEQEPEPPSSAVDRTVRYATADGRGRAVLTPRSVSLPREGTPERLRHRLRGDLDAILMTALRKDPARRYPTVTAFADDVRAYLARRPVSARPDSVLYRAGKFLRRNRWSALAGALVVATAAASGVSFVVQSRRVSKERDRAARIQSFLVSLFSVSDPGEARGNSVTAREVLDKGAEKIRHELKEQPEVRADLMDTIADVYNRLGLNDQAATLARESLDFRRQGGTRDALALSRSLNLLGSILMDKGDLVGAEAAYRESLALRQRLHGPKSLEVAQSLNNLGGILDSLGRYDESDRLHRESLELKRSLLGPEDPSLATGLLNMAVSFYRRGDLKQAEDLLRESLRIQRKALGEDHPETAFTLQSLGVVFDDTGRYAEAEKTYREALALQRKVLGAEHPDIVTTLTNLANTLVHAGRNAEAEAVYGEALPMSRKLYGDGATDTAHVLAGLAEVQLLSGRLDLALGAAGEALRAREALLGPDHPDTAESRVLVGRILLASRRLAEAEPALRAGYEDLAAEAGLEARRRVARDALVELYEKLGKTAEADRFRSM